MRESTAIIPFSVANKGFISNSFPDFDGISPSRHHPALD